MSRGRVIIHEDGNVLILRGWRAADLAREAGLRPLYVGTVGGWMLDAHRLPQLVAWLEHRNVRHELATLDEAPPAAPEAPAPPVSEDTAAGVGIQPLETLW